MLFRTDPMLSRSNLESASLPVVQNRGKYARRVEVWKTESIDRTVHAYQRRRAHVPDNAVVLNGLIETGFHLISDHA